MFFSVARYTCKRPSTSLPSNRGYREKQPVYPIASPFRELIRSLPELAGKALQIFTQADSVFRLRYPIAVWQRSPMSRTPQVAIAMIGAVAVAAIASAEDAGPVIDSVTLRTVTQRYETVYPDFHFHDPSGTVRFIHRAIISTNSPKPLKIQDGVIDISPEQQIKGAVYTGGWTCGPESYFLTVQAFVINLDGQKSNTVEYTIRCNAGR